MMFCHLSSSIRSHRVEFPWLGLSAVGRLAHQATVSAEVPGEEPQGAVQLEGRDLPVLAGVSVQRLLR